MSGDALTMDGIDYIRLGEERRSVLRPWMDELLGSGWQESSVQSVTLGEGFADVVTLVRDKDGAPIRTDDADHWLTERTRLPCRRPPPVWKPLR